MGAVSQHHESKHIFWMTKVREVLKQINLINDAATEHWDNYTEANLGAFFSLSLYSSILVDLRLS